MDIHSPPGTVVRFAHPNNGFPHHQEITKSLLEVGGLYTVTKTVVHRSSTDVYLEGFDQKFNSVMFAPAEESENPQGAK